MGPGGHLETNGEPEQAGGEESRSQVFSGPVITTEARKGPLPSARASRVVREELREPEVSSLVRAHFRTPITESRTLAVVADGFAAALLLFMPILLMSVVWNSSPAWDEPEHTLSGFATLVHRDQRFDSYHPPLGKSLGALPLLFMGAPTPADHRGWDRNQRWQVWHYVLFHGQLDVDRALFFGRLITTSFVLLFCALFYYWSRRRLGPVGASLGLILFCTSPTVIAHGPLIGTTLWGSIGVGLACFACAEFLELRTSRRLLVAGAAMGIGLSLHYGAGIVLLAFPLAVFYQDLQSIPRSSFLRTAITAVAVWFRSCLNIVAPFCLVAFSIVAVVYLLHTANMPASYVEGQTDRIKSWSPLLGGMMETAGAFGALGRGFVWFLQGAVKQLGHISEGHTQPALFLGQLSTGRSPLYFPIIFMLKEQLVFVLLTGLGLAIGLATVLSRARSRDPGPMSMETGTVQLFLVTVLLYLGIAMTGRLHIGVRHLLPIYPCLALLGAYGLLRVSHLFRLGNVRPLMGLQTPVFLGAALVSFLTTVVAWPNFMSYFNPIGSARARTLALAADSNIEWGQDLRRLRDFVQQHQIPKLKLFYWGSVEPQVYLGKVYERMDWRNRPKPGELFAVSAHFLAYSEIARRLNVSSLPNVPVAPPWFSHAKPVAQVGESISVFLMGDDPGGSQPAAGVPRGAPHT